MIQAFIGFIERIGFRGDVPVVETPELNAQFGKEFKRGRPTSFLRSSLDRWNRCTPGS